MSWSLISQCENCKRVQECVDLKYLQESVNKIHRDPDHVGKGGSGNLVISCYKHERDQ